MVYVFQQLGVYVILGFGFWYEVLLKLGCPCWCDLFTDLVIYRVSLGYSQG